MTTLDQTNKEIYFDEWVFEPETPYSFSIMGVDPGTAHLGVAVYDDQANMFFVWEIHLERETTMERRMLVMEEIMKYAMPPGADFLVIEGAGYMSSSYRQAELEDVRCASVLYKRLCNPKMKIDVVPPNSIRKVVFGSAKIKNPWKDVGLPDNAAAALGCALYPIYIGK